MKKIMAILAAASVLAVGVFTGCKAEEGDTIIINGENVFRGTLSGSVAVTVQTTTTGTAGTASTTTYTYNNQAASYTWTTNRSGNGMQFNLKGVDNAVTTDSAATPTKTKGVSKGDDEPGVVVKVGGTYYVSYTTQEWVDANHGGKTVNKFVKVTPKAGSFTSGNFTYSYEYTSRSYYDASNSYKDTKYTGTDVKFTSATALN